MIPHFSRLVYSSDISSVHLFRWHSIGSPANLLCVVLGLDVEKPHAAALVVTRSAATAAKGAAGAAGACTETDCIVYTCPNTVCKTMQ